MSKWTWAATLLQSSNVAYTYGIAGPFWYAAGATIQVLLFSVLAIEIKRKCPSIHTVLEIVLARWGTTAHIVFLFFCIMTNFIVTAMLILGGAAVVTAVTGVNIYAASMLIPISVVFYTAQGGLLACFISSWGHVTVIYIALLIFVWKVYAGPSELGSTDKVWENLMVAGAKYEVKNNYAGSYLTMWSRSGIIFGIINIIGNFGTVFVDQSYWQGAIAARPSATYKGYLLGGIAWFAIPFTMATTLGLAGRALDLPITIQESNEGLVPPAVAIHLIGAGGAFLITFQLFMAVTATGSAEQIAVSSLFAYDVWKRYVKPDVSGKEIILVSRIMIFIWGILSGILAIILFELKISLGWVYQAMGNFIGSAVAPIAMSITWRQCTANAAIWGALGGLAFSITTWLVLAHQSECCGGKINVASLGDEIAFLGANIAALFTSPVIVVIITYLEGGQNYNWEDLNKTTESYLIEEDRHAHKDQQMVDEDSPEAMDQAYLWTIRTGTVLSFILIVAWPLLTLPQYTFTKSYWGWWVAIAFLWGHFAAIITIVLPIWEARAFILHVLNIKPMDFSATVRERPEYDPAGPNAMRALDTKAAPVPEFAQPMAGQHKAFSYPQMPYGMPMMYPGAPLGGSPNTMPIVMPQMPMGAMPMPTGMGSYPMTMGYPGTFPTV